MVSRMTCLRERGAHGVANDLRVGVDPSNARGVVFGSERELRDVVFFRGASRDEVHDGFEHAKFDQVRQGVDLGLGRRRAPAKTLDVVDDVRREDRVRRRTWTNLRRLPSCANRTTQTRSR